MAPPLRLTLQNTLVLPLAICLPLRKTGEEWGSSLGFPWRDPGPTKDPTGRRQEIDFC